MKFVEASFSKAQVTPEEMPQIPFSGTFFPALCNGVVHFVKKRVLSLQIGWWGSMANQREVSEVFIFLNKMDHTT